MANGTSGVIMDLSEVAAGGADEGERRALARHDAQPERHLAEVAPRGELVISAT